MKKHYYFLGLHEIVASELRDKPEVGAMEEGYDSGYTYIGHYDDEVNVFETYLKLLKQFVKTGFVNYVKTTTDSEFNYQFVLELDASQQKYEESQL